MALDPRTARAIAAIRGQGNSYAPSDATQVGLPGTPLTAGQSQADLAKLALFAGNAVFGGAPDQAPPRDAPIKDKIAWLMSFPGVMPVGKIVYHGTPNWPFEPTPQNALGEFRLGSVGWGENTQNQGHGIYLTESDPASRFYAKQSIGSPTFYSVAGQRFYKNTPEYYALHQIRYMEPNLVAGNEYEKRRSAVALFRSVQRIRRESGSSDLPVKDLITHDPLRYALDAPASILNHPLNDNMSTTYQGIPLDFQPSGIREAIGAVREHGSILDAKNNLNGTIEHSKMMLERFAQKKESIGHLTQHDAYIVGYYQHEADNAKNMLKYLDHLDMGQVKSPINQAVLDVDLSDAQIPNLLKWNLPLDRQSPMVTDALERLTPYMLQSTRQGAAKFLGKEAYRDLSDQVLSGRAYNRPMANARASQLLLNEGVPGHVYESGHRNTNYVIWDPKVLNIVKARVLNK